MKPDKVFLSGPDGEEIDISEDVINVEMKGAFVAGVPMDLSIQGPWVIRAVGRLTRWGALLLQAPWVLWKRKAN